MITTQIFLGYIFLGSFIAFCVGFTINGIYSLFKELR